MKYVCLVYQEEDILDALAGDRCEAIIRAELDSQEELRQCGSLMASTSLQSVCAATTVRVRNGKVTVTDGPFAETKEQLGGIYLIEARDLNEAIRVAAKMPAARLGSIEVRPLQQDRETSNR